MKPYIASIFAVFPLIISLNSCTTVSSTADFYRPLTSEVYPPKPKDYTILVLGAPPQRPYTVIGRLSFESGHGNKYMMDAIRYNARKNGADAAIMVDEAIRTEKYNYTVPGYTTTTPVTTHSSGSAYGSANYFGSGAYGHASSSVHSSATSTTYIPQYHPGHTGVKSVTIQGIDVLLIRYK